MSYTLQLTSNERKAFDWVGNRYAVGDIARLLTSDSCLQVEDHEWDSSEPLTFYIPEHVAWRIRELAEEENFMFPCFSEELVHKLNQFLDRIV